MIRGYVDILEGEVGMEDLADVVRQAAVFTMTRQTGDLLRSSFKLRISQRRASRRPRLPGRHLASVEWYRTKQRNSMAYCG